jgi:amino acid permease
MGIQTVYSVKLYLAAKDFLPGNPGSMFEIGYILFKRTSIFYICAIIIMNSFGLMLIYFIVFGDTLSSLMINLSKTDSIDVDSFFGQRKAYVIILGAMLTPLILKKELQELKIISVFLFVAIFSFILLTISQLIINGVQIFNGDFNDDNPPEFDHIDYYLPKYTNIEMLKGLSIILVSFSCQ